MISEKYLDELVIELADLKKLKEVLKSHKLTPSQLTLGVEGLRKE